VRGSAGAERRRGTDRRIGGVLAGSVGTYAGLGATDAGLLGDPRIVYESECRLFPTEHTRGSDTNVVETGTYGFDVVVEAATSGPARCRRRGRPSAVITSG